MTEENTAHPLRRQIVTTEQELLDTFKRALDEHHRCLFDEEERALIRDVISVGKNIKRAAAWGIAIFIMVGALSVFLIQILQALSSIKVS